MIKLTDEILNFIIDDAVLHLWNKDPKAAFKFLMTSDKKKILDTLRSKMTKSNVKVTEFIMKCYKVQSYNSRTEEPLNKLSEVTYIGIILEGNTLDANNDDSIHVYAEIKDNDVYLIARKKCPNDRGINLNMNENGEVSSNDIKSNKFTRVFHYDTMIPKEEVKFIESIIGELS